jgi:hypothetical protein
MLIAPIVLVAVGVLMIVVLIRRRGMTNAGASHYSNDTSWATAGDAWDRSGGGSNDCDSGGDSGGGCDGGGDGGGGGGD